MAFDAILKPAEQQKLPNSPKHQKNTKPSPQRLNRLISPLDSEVYSKYSTNSKRKIKLNLPAEHYNMSTPQ